MSWCERYSLGGLQRLSEAARNAIWADAQEVADRCLSPDKNEQWPCTRVRTGLVVGSVQSGKTANMLAVVASLMDSKSDILILLAGTRIALWKQT